MSSLGASVGSLVSRGPVRSAHGWEPPRMAAKTGLAQRVHCTLKQGTEHTYPSAGQSPGRRILHRKCLIRRTRMTAQGIRARYESGRKGGLSPHPPSSPLPSHIPLLCPPGPQQPHDRPTAILVLYPPRANPKGRCHQATAPRKTLKASRCGSQDLLFKFTCHQISNFSQGCPPPSITVKLTTASASNSSAFPCPASPCHAQILMPTGSTCPVTPELLSASPVPPPLFDLAKLICSPPPRKTPVSPATVH